jgi:hypothetical protein
MSADAISNYCLSFEKTSVGIVNLTSTKLNIVYLEMKMLERKPKRYRYPAQLISIAVWSYHRSTDSYRDVSERLLYRGIDVSYETIRNGALNLGSV